VPAYGTNHAELSLRFVSVLAAELGVDGADLWRRPNESRRPLLSPRPTTA